MSTYKDNIELVVKRFPELADKLTGKPSEQLMITSAKSAVPTGIFESGYIHSRFDPVKESVKLIEQECHEEISICFFYGFGLGYHVEAFMQKRPNTPVLVIEPDPFFFMKALTSRCLGRVFSSPMLYLFLRDKPEALPALLENYPLDNPKIIKLRSVYSKDEKYYKQIDGVAMSSPLGPTLANIFLGVY